MIVIYLRGIMIFCLSQAVELGSTMNEGMKKVSTRVTFVLSFCFTDSHLENMYLSILEVIIVKGIHTHSTHLT